MNANLEFFYSAKAAGVFQHLDDQRVREICAEVGNNNIVPVMCGDCDHSDDKITHLKRKFPGIGRHLLAWNGGGLLLDPKSPANQLGLDCSPFAHFQVGQSLAVKKRISQVFIETHYPCAVARDAGLTIEGQVRSLIAIKAILKERYSQRDVPVRIGLLFHLFDEERPEDEARRMYFFKADRMNGFLLSARPGVAQVS